MITRREFLAGLGASTAIALGVFHGLAKAGVAPISRPIPASGEHIPIIGMGSWISFNVGSDPAARAVRQAVMRTFFERGGAMIDSSPMYGSSEEVLGYCLRGLGPGAPLFSATKVWTTGQGDGIVQMSESEQLWGAPGFDLIQVHNLLDWETHLETLGAWKAEGRVRYIGVTTSHGRRHELLEQVMAAEDLDFVQFTYNIRDRWAEERLLPLARERGLAVIVNRPFAGGDLFPAVESKPLPEWAGEFDCANWAQFFLKFIVSHPAVTCAIPATSRVDHMLENTGVLRGRLPPPELRERMARHFDLI